MSGGRLVTITPYTWNGTFNPCVTFDHKWTDHPFFLWDVFTLTYYPPWTVHVNCDIPSICNILYSWYILSSNDTFLIFYILLICNILPNCYPVVTIRLFCDILSTCASSPLCDFPSTCKTFPLLWSCTVWVPSTGLWQWIQCSTTFSLGKLPWKWEWAIVRRHIDYFSMAKGLQEVTAIHDRAYQKLT